MLFVAQDALDDPQCVGMHATRKANALQRVALYAEQPALLAVVLDEKDEFVTWVRREWPQAPLSNVRDQR